MSDVRLTATNPEDSSVVPVACNVRGELLIEEPTIEVIDNDLDVSGVIRSAQPDDVRKPTGSYLGVKTDDIEIGQIYSPGAASVYITAGGYRNANDTWTSWEVSESSKGACDIRLATNRGRISFHCEDNWTTGMSASLTERFAIGVGGPESFDLTLRRQQDSRSWKEQISVFEELYFLRNQLRATMEKLRLTPEGGWEVWDGSSS